MSLETITCPYCLMTSYHPGDIENGYCGNCHDWTLSKRIQEIQAETLRVLEDGREISVCRMIFNWRLNIGPAGSDMLDDFYCYGGLRDCVAAMNSWDGSGDPPGRWHRHGKSARRREWIKDEAGEWKLEREWVQP